MKQPNSLPWSQFRRRTPDASRVFLDTGRAEVMFNMICLPDLLSSSRLTQFIGAAQIASDGTGAILDLLIDAFSQWHEMDDALEAKVRRLWSKRPPNISVRDAIAELRNRCSHQQIPLPTDLVEAIFDDPSFDFVAYLAWHNSGDDQCEMEVGR